MALLPSEIVGDMQEQLILLLLRYLTSRYHLGATQVSCHFHRDKMDNHVCTACLLKPFGNLIDVGGLLLAPCMRFPRAHIVYVSLHLVGDSDAYTIRLRQEFTIQ
jgi:hypothetical protein